MHTVEFTSCLTAGWKYVDILLHFLLLPSHVIKIEVPMKIRLINKWGHSTSLTTWRQSSVCDKHSIKLPWWRICKWSFWWWSSAEHVCWTDAKRKKKNHIPDLSGQDSKPVSLLQTVTDATCEQQKGTPSGAYNTQSAACWNYVSGEHTSTSELKKGLEIYTQYLLQQM